MRRVLPALVLVALFVGASASADDLEVPRCVEVTKSAPWVSYGHNHLVRIRNGCERAVRCDVSTDATPERTTVEVAPDTTREVLTRRGSPSSVFEARVDCDEIR